MLVSGGNVSVTGITMNPPGSGGTVSLTTTGGNIYLGNVGIVNNAGSGGTISLNGGTVGALSNWSSSANMGVGGSITIQGADAGAVGHNISLSGSLSGGGNITIAGAGVVSLSGSNTYSNGTAVNSGGTLMVNSADTVNGGTGPGALAVAGTLGGTGNTNSPVVISSGGTLAPGGALGIGPSKLTINNNLTINANANLDYLEATASAVGQGSGDDFTQVNGNVTINPTLAINIVGGAGFNPTGTYDLVAYTGSITDKSGGYSGWTVTGVAPGTTETFSTDPGNLDVALIAPAAPAAPGAPDNPAPFVPPTPNTHPSTHFVGYNENCTNTSGISQTQVNIVLNGNFAQAGDVIGNYPTFGPDTTYNATYDATTNTTTVTVSGSSPIAAGHVAHVGYSLLNGTGGGEMESPETAYKYWGMPVGGTPSQNLRLPAPSWFVSNPGQGPSTEFVILYSTIELANGQVAGEWDEQQIPAGQPFQIGLGNLDNLDGPMFAFNVGFQFSNTMIPLDDLNLQDYPPPGAPGSTFMSVPGIPDASPIDPGSSLLSQTLQSPDVPEPASLGLLAAGSLMTLRRRRRRTVAGA
jgi:hypothetical protein